MNMDRLFLSLILPISLVFVLSACTHNIYDESAPIESSGVELVGEGEEVADAGDESNIVADIDLNTGDEIAMIIAEAEQNDSAPKAAPMKKASAKLKASQEAIEPTQEMTAQTASLTDLDAGEDWLPAQESKEPAIEAPKVKEASTGITGILQNHLFLLALLSALAIGSFFVYQLSRK